MPVLLVDGRVSWRTTVLVLVCDDPHETGGGRGTTCCQPSAVADKSTREVTQRRESRTDIPTAQSAPLPCPERYPPFRGPILPLWLPLILPAPRSAPWFLTFDSTNHNGRHTRRLRAAAAAVWRARRACARRSVRFKCLLNGSAGAVAGVSGLALPHPPSSLVSFPSLSAYGALTTAVNTDADGGGGQGGRQAGRHRAGEARTQGVDTCHHAGERSRLGGRWAFSGTLTASEHPPAAGGEGSPLD